MAKWSNKEKKGTSVVGGYRGTLSDISFLGTRTVWIKGQVMNMAHFLSEKNFLV